MAAGAEQWIEGLAPDQFRHLFDRLPGTMFFAKDTRFRLRMGNPAFVARCGFEREAELVGLTDAEIFAPRLAQKYRADDERVLAVGEPLLGIIELFPDASGDPGWYVTDKLPLFARNGRVAGLCGTVRSYEGQRAALQPYLDLAPVAEHIKAHFREPLALAELARLAGLSPRHLRRKFQQTFQTTPRGYLMRMRVLHACELLAQTALPITQVAFESGFYDHSDFARHFHRQMGQTASAYRAAASAR
ncbi:MAG: helix-turn-helix domain-containing protein [Planctomycetes bacterium]|nr:helix-turn-helix domain-containing protein [Planctomycetota bacterium]